MPEEILAIVIISIFAGTSVSIVRMILGYRERTRFGGRGGSADQSMTTSELERMIRSAVADAVRPVATRLDRLEGRPQAQLPERSGVLGIDDQELDDLAPEEEPARRTRTR